MNLTDEGIKQIEAHADKEHNALVMLMCQILREVREVKKMLSDHNDNPSNGSDDSTGGADYSENEHS